MKVPVSQASLQNSPMVQVAADGRYAKEADDLVAAQRCAMATSTTESSLISSERVTTVTEVEIH